MSATHITKARWIAVSGAVAIALVAAPSASAGGRIPASVGATPKANAAPAPTRGAAAAGLPQARHPAPADRPRAKPAPDRADRRQRPAPRGPVLRRLPYEPRRRVPQRPVQPDARRTAADRPLARSRHGHRLRRRQLDLRRQRHRLLAAARLVVRRLPLAGSGCRQLDAVRRRRHRLGHVPDQQPGRLPRTSSRRAVATWSASG